MKLSYSNVLVAFPITIFVKVTFRYKLQKSISIKVRRYLEFSETLNDILSILHDCCVISVMLFFYYPQDAHKIFRTMENYIFFDSILIIISCIKNSFVYLIINMNNNFVSNFKQNLK